MNGKQAWVVAAAGWFAACCLAYCGTDGLQHSQEMDWVPDANAADGVPAPEGVHPGTLWVVDSGGTPVGVLYDRRHPMLEENEAYDAVSVYNPHKDLFFTVRMSTGEVLRPGKVFFADGSCSGSAGIRANCTDCVSGRSIAFKSGNTWYRVDDLATRQQFTYLTYLPEALGEPCVAHGSSQTYVFPARALSAGDAPPDFMPPYSFRWVP